MNSFIHGMEGNSNVSFYSPGYQSTKPNDFQFFRTTTTMSLEYAEEDHTYKSMYGKFFIQENLLFLLPYHLCKRRQAKKKKKGLVLHLKKNWSWKCE